jgi:MFS family permease
VTGLIPLAATTFIQILTAMAALTVPAFAPELARELGVPNSLIGNYISMVYVGAASATLIGGSMVARVGGLRLSQISLLICGTGLLMSLITSVPAIAIAALVLGIGYGPITPASSHLLARAAPTHLRSLMFSIRQTGVPAGGALAGIIVPSVTVLFGWRWALALVALMCIALALLLQPLREKFDDDRKRDQPISMGAIVASLRLVAHEPQLRMLAIVSFVFAGMQMCTSTFLITYLVESFSMPLVKAGTALAAANLGGIIFRIGWGWVADKWIAPRTLLGLIAVVMAGLAIGVGFFSVSTPYALILVVSFALGATAIGWNGVYLAEVVRLAPSGLAGAATGGCLFFTFIGVVINPVLFGMLQRATGAYRDPFIVAGTVSFLVGLFLLWTRERHRRSAPVRTDA